ncbi:MAG TPA: type II toxin-antitoxin system PemK/MazF family toxin, partial [Candidatus Binatia bacterium]|nr:type II toxin-antitoxin system PemK/MazF family toxin [Candidatus Binatia bacterium]
NPGDVVAVNFPGATGIKRRPAVILSSAVYYSSRPDVIVGLITSQTAAAVGPTDYLLQDWTQAGLRVPSAFRSFLATLPPSTNPVLVGHLSARDWQGVRVCVKAALAPLDDPASPAAPTGN